MGSCIRDCALITGMGLGVTVAIPLTFAAGVVSVPFLLVGGIPYLIYRSHRKNKAEEDLKRIGASLKIRRLIRNPI